MGNLVRTPLSEITATLEKLSELGVTPECLGTIRKGGIRAWHIADAMITAAFGGYTDEQSFREKMASDRLFFSPQDWSNRFGLLPEVIGGDDRGVPWEQDVLDLVDPLDSWAESKCISSTHHAIYIPRRCSTMLGAPTSLQDLVAVMSKNCHQLHDVGTINPVNLTPMPGWHLIRLTPLSRTESRALDLKEAVRPGYKVADIATAYATLLMMHEFGQPTDIKETTFLASYSTRLRPLVIVESQEGDNLPFITEVRSISGTRGRFSLVTERKTWSYQSPSQLERR